MCWKVESKVTIITQSFFCGRTYQNEMLFSTPPVQFDFDIVTVMFSNIIIKWTSIKDEKLFSENQINVRGFS